ncbi:hypothetical protein DFJ74DRAFT_754414 [Hyaloraphidium curvatum]|nr:hypothetical protein DFJ74DRAFT_754414 [Hyaloraphidium curvatum]
MALSAQNSQLLSVLPVAVLLVFTIGFWASMPVSNYSSANSASRGLDGAAVRDAGAPPAAAPRSPPAPPPAAPPPKDADGCRHVYLDLGTNLGVQIRKLYEPHLYPNSSVLPVFGQYFPGDRSEVCAFGFEPNPVHKERLETLERTYRAMGWRVKVFQAAVTDRDGDSIDFYTNPGDAAGGGPGRQWGARLGEPPVAKYFPNGTAREMESSEALVKVATMDFPTWFRSNVVGRIISPPRSGTGVPPSVVMKLDIEGADLSVFKPMIYLGLFCHVDYLYLELHVGAEFLRFAQTLFADPPAHYGCAFNVTSLDDEMYGTDGKPWPKPPNVTGSAGAG